MGKIVDLQTNDQINPLGIEPKNMVFFWKQTENYEDENTCNPLKLWHDLGEPANLSQEQKKLLQDAAKPFICSQRVCKADAHSAARTQRRS